MSSSLRSRVNKLAYEGHITQADADRIRDALVKHIPTKPKKDSDGIYCCICGYAVKLEYEGIIWVHGFCPYCGQLQDWSKVDEE